MSKVSKIYRECFSRECDGILHEVWYTEGFPYGKNIIEVCQKCFSKSSRPAGELPTTKVYSDRVKK